MLCTGCQHWCHLSRCSGLASEKQYKKKDYRCPSCVRKIKVTPQIDNPPSPIGQSDDNSIMYMTPNYLPHAVYLMGTL